MPVFSGSCYWRYHPHGNQLEQAGRCCSERNNLYRIPGAHARRSGNLRLLGSTKERHPTEWPACRDGSTTHLGVRIQRSLVCLAFRPYGACPLPILPEFKLVLCVPIQCHQRFRLLWHSWPCKLFCVVTPRSCCPDMCCFVVA